VVGSQSDAVLPAWAARCQTKDDVSAPQSLVSMFDIVVFSLRYDVPNLKMQ
jgi:hypothetical protein